MADEEGPTGRMDDPQTFDPGEMDAMSSQAQGKGHGWHPTPLTLLLGANKMS
jgi:hypothetical protein